MKRSCAYLIVFASALLGAISCSTDKEDSPSEIRVSSLGFSGIDPDQGAVTLSVGDSLKLGATVSPSNATNKNVSWASGSPEVAQVAQDGTVTALATGEATLTVRADDGSQVEASIALRVLDTENAITSFTIVGHEGYRTEIYADSIALTFPAGSDVDLGKLSPEIGHTGKSIDPASGVEQDFENKMVVYTVTAEDGQTHGYEVNIRRTLESTNSITSFTVNGNAATIQGDAISFTFPAGSDVDLSKLAPVIGHTGKSIAPGSGVEQDFENKEVVYTVTAENGETKTYTASIDVALLTAESDRAALMAIYDANPEAQSELANENWGSESPLNEWFGVETNAEGRVTELQFFDYIESEEVSLNVLPREIGNLTALELLDLRKSNLTDLPDELFHLTKLRVLGVWRNKLTSIPADIGKLTALEELYLDDNQLSSIPESIGKLTKLRDLHISGNEFTSFPTEILQLTALEELSLNSNQLNSLPDRIGELAQLQGLYLSANQLSRIPESIGELTKLETLALSVNQLSSLPDRIGELTALTSLALNVNQLSSLPDRIGELTALTSLGLNVNQLSSLPDRIGELTALTSLRLNNNQLSEIPESIGELTKLEVLFLGYNQLTGIPENVGNLTALRQLALNNNQLTGIPNSVCILGNSMQSGYFTIDDGVACE